MALRRLEDEPKRAESPLVATGGCLTIVYQAPDG